MNNTIPFKSTSRTIRSEQITVDVSILSVLNHAASPGRRELDSNIYLAAIAPDMELNIIMEEDICEAKMQRSTVMAWSMAQPGGAMPKTLSLFKHPSLRITSS